MFERNIKQSDDLALLPKHFHVGSCLFSFNKFSAKEKFKFFLPLHFNRFEDLPQHHKLGISTCLNHCHFRTLLNLTFDMATQKPHSQKQVFTNKKKGVSFLYKGETKQAMANPFEHLDPLRKSPENAANRLAAEERLIEEQQKQMQLYSSSKSNTGATPGTFVTTTTSGKSVSPNNTNDETNNSICPICLKRFGQSEIEFHVNSCLDSKHSESPTPNIQKPNNDEEVPLSKSSDLILKAQEENFDFYRKKKQIEEQDRLLAEKLMKEEQKIGKPSQKPNDLKVKKKIKCERFSCETD